MPLEIVIDGAALAAPGTGRVWLTAGGEGWSASTEPPDPSRKGPHRGGPFKDAFRNHMVFVYGTQGSAGERAWAYAKARFDAETFRYRGNGAVDVATASVAAVSGTGPAGFRLTDRLPYFVSGVAYPDLIVIGPSMLTEGAAGVRGAGFFGPDWTLDAGQFAWR